MVWKPMSGPGYFGTRFALNEFHVLLCPFSFPPSAALLARAGPEESILLLPGGGIPLARKVPLHLLGQKLQVRGRFVLFFHFGQAPRVLNSVGFGFWPGGVGCAMYGSWNPEPWWCTICLENVCNRFRPVVRSMVG